MSHTPNHTDRRGPSLPSHLTQAMARRHLNRCGIVISAARIWVLSRPGNALEGETHDGALLIPRWRLMEFLDARLGKKAAQASADPGEQTPEPQA